MTNESPYMKLARVSIITAILALFCISSASARSLLVMIPLQGQFHSTPKWLCSAIDSDLAYKLSGQPGVDAYWRVISNLYDPDQKRPANKPFSTTELADIGRWSGARAVVSGWCGLDSQEISIHLVVWTKSGCTVLDRQFLMSDSCKDIGPLTLDILKFSGVKVKSANVARILKPDLSGPRSFEMAGKIPNDRGRKSVIRLVDQWVKVDKNSPLPVYYESYGLDDQPTKALALLRQASKLDPGHIEMLCALGDQCVKAGDLKGGKEAYARANRLDPDSPFVAIRIAHVMRKSGDSVGAEKCFADATNLCHTWFYHFSLAEDLCDSQECDWALKNQGLALKNDGPSRVIYPRMAHVYDIEKRWDEAVAAVESALQEDPDSGWLNYLLGYELYRSRDYDNAERYLRIALDKRPKDPRVHRYLGYVLMRQMEWPEAEKELKKAVKLDQENQYAREALAQVYEYQFKYISAMKMSGTKTSRQLIIFLGFVAFCTITFVGGIVAFIRRIIQSTRSRWTSADGVKAKSSDN